NARYQLKAFLPYRGFNPLEQQALMVDPRIITRISRAVRKLPIELIECPADYTKSPLSPSARRLVFRLPQRLSPDPRIRLVAGIMPVAIPDLMHARLRNV